MVVTAENSGNLLNDTINNIIDLAKLDPDNTTECVKIQGDGSSTPLPVTDGSVMEEVDIRELCQKVAEQTAKLCTDKNVVVIPSWTKPSLTSLSSSVSATAATGGSAANFGSVQSTNGYTSSSESLSSFSARRLRNERKAILELMVALDEPERNPDQDTAWNFVFDVTSMTRILKQVSGTITNPSNTFLGCNIDLPYSSYPLLSSYIISWWRMLSSSQQQALWNSQLFL
jgi:hypothetical protein